MCRRVVLPVLVGILVCSVWASTSTADVVWLNDRPVFRGDGNVRERPRRRTSTNVRQPTWRRTSRPVRPVYPRKASGGSRPNIAPEAPDIVALPRKEEAGTIIIDQHNRRLYYVLTATEAYLYPISVGRDGFRWNGTKKISAVQAWPRWTPPAQMRKRQPWLPVTMSGGLRNPLGAKALYLGSSLYRIHGTNDPKSIGRASSSGCFRMMNAHVVHLATMAGVGTTVHVMSRYPDCKSPQCQADRISSR